MDGRSACIRWTALLLVGLSLSACAKRPAPIAPPVPRGEVGYRFLTTGRSPLLAADEELTSPRPRAPLRLPDYPANALAGGAAPSTVGVRFVIGTEGTVIEVLDSPRLTSTPGPYAAEFRRAVEETVRTWLFSPGAVTRFENGTDLDGDGEPDYRRFVSSRSVEVFYDVTFEFRTSTDGAPQVTAVSH